MHYRGIVREKTIELEELLPYANGQPVNVIIEPRLEYPVTGSPAALRQAMHELPHLKNEDVEELEQAIATSQLPVHPEGVFDEGK